MDLTDGAIASTLEFIASTPAGGGVVFDYAVPRASLGWIERIAFDSLSRRVAAAGKPFLTCFEPLRLQARLATGGFSNIVDFGRDELNGRFFDGRADGLRVRGGWAESVQRWLDAEQEPPALSSTSIHRSYNVELRSAATASK